MKNAGQRCSSGIITTSLSDHFSTCLILDEITGPHKSKTIKVRKINNKTIPMFVDILEKAPFNEILQTNDPKLAWEVFTKY